MSSLSCWILPTALSTVLRIPSREFPTPPQGVNTPNFRATQLHLDNPLISHRGVLNIIITFAKYEQYLVYELENSA